MGTRLWRSLVHSAVMVGLAATMLPHLIPVVMRRPIASRIALMLGVLAALPAVGSVTACGVIAFVQGHHALWPCLGASFLVNALITSTVGLGVTLYEMQRSQLSHLTLEMRTRELTHEGERKSALEARLSSLEARIQPHFLFNTLNAISALIPEDPERAERTVERLAALLRFSLDATERGIVPLAEELTIVADYLEIEKTRLGARLSYTLDVHPDVRHWLLPPFAVQTLVENSVKHAIASRPRGGAIRVTAGRVGDGLVVSVWDDGPGFTIEALRPGHGLETLQGRLAARYGDGARFEVGRREAGTVVTITVPESPADRPVRV